MKTTTKKLLALVLAMLMLIGMIPAGMVVSAADAATIDLDVYNEETGYVINNIADWNLISEASFDGNTFNGKKVTLGANIDAGGAALPTLFKLLEGEFDGNGKTVSNATAVKALIAYKTQQLVNIHDLTVSGVTVNHNSTEECAIIVGGVANVTGGSDSTTLSNVTVTGCTLTGFSGSGGGKMGFLIGYVASYVPAKIYDCKVINSTLNGSIAAGMAVGSCHGHVEILNIEVSGSFKAIRTYTKADGTVEGLGGDIGGIIGGVYNGGQTVTIKNAKVDVDFTQNDNTDAKTGAVHSGMVVGRQDKNSKLTIENVEATGSIKAAFYQAAGVIAKTSVQSGAFLKIKNVKVDVDIDSDHTGAKNNRYVVSGVLGESAFYNDQAACGEITIENVTVEGTLKSNGRMVAGILALSAGGSSTVIFDHSVTIRNCEMLADITAGHEINNLGVGAIVGAWGGTDAWQGGNGKDKPYKPYYSTGTLTIENCYAGGTITATGDKNCLATMIGQLGYYGPTTVNINNCVLSTTFPGRSMAASAEANAAALVIGRSMRTGATVNVNNCVHTYEGEMGTDLVLLANGYNLTINGTLFKGSYTYYADDSILAVSAEQAAAMIKKNDSGYITRIGGQLTGGYLQDTVADGATLTANDTYAIRFIALSQLANPASAGITVVVKNPETGAIIKTFDTTECKTYDALLSYSVTGEPLEYYDVADYGASKFLAVVIQGIPGGTAYDFEVTPHYTTEGGIVITGDTLTASYDANGQLIG